MEEANEEAVHKGRCDTELPTTNRLGREDCCSCDCMPRLMNSSAKLTEDITEGCC